MKLGILGTGKIVKDFLKLIDTLNVERVSILGTEKTKEETEFLTREYRLDESFYDYDEMLKSDIDTVYVALPNSLHFPFAKKGLQNGKHVIIEKPIVSTSAELTELEQLAKDRHRMVFEAMNVHYMPAYTSLKEQLKALGDLKIVSLNYSQYSSRYDAFKRGELPPAFDYKKAGGALMDLNVYNLHCIIGLFGEPKSVNYLANIERSIDTSGVLTLGYDGFIAVCIGAKDCKAPILCSFQGDKGNITLNEPMNRLRRFTLTDNSGNSQEFAYSQDIHRLYYEFIEFIRIIDEKDYGKMAELLQRSEAVLRVLEKAKKQSGILFA